MSYKLFIKREPGVTKIPKGFKKEARTLFDEEFQGWKREGQKNLDTTYELLLCEEIKRGTEEDYVSLPILVGKTDVDETDGGYLYVYGWKEVEN